MGQHPLTHDPCDPSNNGDPCDPLTHDPPTHRLPCYIVLAPRLGCYCSISLFFEKSLITCFDILICYVCYHVLGIK